MNPSQTWSARTWSAMVAPLGEECLVLDQACFRLPPDAEWRLNGSRVPLRPEPRGHEGPAAIGEVTALHADGDKLMVSGLLYDHVDVAALDGLAPQVDLDLSVDGVVTLRALTLGESPLWPDLWFRVDPAPLAAPPVSS